MAKLLACLGCEKGHAEIEEVVACQAAEQQAVRAALDAADAAEPKKDRRYLRRSTAPLLKAERQAKERQ